MPAVGDAFPEVLAAAQAGQEWAVRVLYRAWSGSVLRYLQARIPGEAEDVASQVWLEVATGLNRFEGSEAAFRAWLFTIAARRASNWHRGRRRRPQTPVDPATLPEMASLDDPADAAEHGVEAARALVVGLPAEQAEVVLLRVVGGLGVEEVARVLGKRPGTVRVLQHRAMKRLAEQHRSGYA